MFKCCKILISYITGILSGIFIFIGIQVFLSRDGSVGGEILILPLFIMLITIGYWMAQEFMEHDHYYKGRQEGIRIGKDKGYLMGVKDLTAALKSVKDKAV